MLKRTMHNRNRKQLVGFLGTSILVILMLASCAGPTPTPALTPAPAPTRSAAPAPTPAPAPGSANEFFKNNVVNLIFAGAAGSTPDFAARLFASHWPDVTGGVMRVINKPGGGGLPGVNEVWDAKPDGLTIGAGVLGERITSPVGLKNPVIKYMEADRFNYIGAFVPQPWMFNIAAKLPYESMADLQKAKGLKFGSTGKIQNANVNLAVVTELFGLDAKVISGFTGAAEVGLTVGRGEIDGHSYTDSTSREHNSKGWTKPLLCVTEERSALFPNLPTIPEVLKLSPEQKQLLETLWGLYLPGNVIFAPPGVPEDRVKFMRDSFLSVMKLAPFQSVAKSYFGALPPATSGEDVQASIVRALSSLSQERLDRLYKVIDKYTTTLK